MLKQLRLCLSKLLLPVLLAVGVNVWGQATNPTAHNLASGNYTLFSYNATSFPASMAIGVHNGSDGAWTANSTIDAVNGSSNHQWNAEGDNGISWRGGGTYQNASFLLNTISTGRVNITVSWTVKDIAVDNNTNYIELQWKNGSGTWQNVTNDIYTQGTTASGTAFNVVLPTGANNLADLKIRWIYYEVGTGTRDRLAIDDITVSSSSADSSPFLAATGTLSHGATCLNSAANSINYTINNTGAAEATGITVVSSNSTEFVVSNLSSTTIPASGSATFTVTFTPSASGARVSTITIASTSTGSNSPTLALTGTGTATINPSVINNAAGANSISSSGATLRGVINAVGVCPNSTERGFVYSKASDSILPVAGALNVVTAPYTATALTNNGYSLAVTGLLPGTQYYYRSYILTDGVYAYAPAISFTTDAATAAVVGTLNENTLNGATLTVTLTGDTYTASVSASAFTLSGAPDGVTITDVTLNSTTQVTVTLGYDGTDFESNYNAFKVNINNSVLTQSTAPIASASRIVNAVVETLAASPTSLSNINYVVDNGPSAAQEISVSSSNLGTGFGPLLFTAPTNYEVSTTNATTGFGPTASLSYTGTGTFSSNKVYVRLKSGLLLGNYNSETISVSGGKFSSSSFVTLNGSVTTPPPANDDCTNAVALTVGAADVPATTSGATQSLAPVVCEGSTLGSSNDDVWFSFTTTVAAEYTIYVTGSSSFDAVIDVRTGTCASSTSVGCGDFTGTGFVEDLPIVLSANTIYYIRVYHLSASAPADSSFSIRIAAPPATLTTNGTSAINFSSVDMGTNSSQSFNLSGISLTGAPDNISITSSNSNFEVSNDNATWGSSTTVAYTTSEFINTPVYVRFAPQTTGALSGTITISGGGVSPSPTVSVTGTGIFPAPVATEETSLTIAGTGFVAHWDSTGVATGYRLDVSTSNEFTAGGLASNLFISEYAEGSGGNKKYIEIYNGTGAAVNLSNYKIWTITNGGSWPEGTINLSGTLANNDVYVIANNATDVPGADLYNGSIVTWNGNDAVGLAWNGGSGTTYTLLDAVGTTTDPGTGWSVAGTVNATVDKILIRKSTVLAPNTNWTVSAGTNSDNSEWTVSAFTYNDASQATNLGSHTFSGGVSSFVSGYENLAVSGTSINVTGLTAGNTYYYRVRAEGAGNITSANSNVITAIAKTPNVWNGTAWTPLAPGSADVAIIAGDYNTNTNGTFEAQQLFINSGILTVASGTTLEIEGTVENNMTAANFIVENGGNFIQHEEGDNTGNMTIFRDTNELFKLDYTFWSSPVFGQNLYAFSPATNATRFYAYGASGTESYNSITPANAAITNNGTTDFVPGRGYLIRMPNELTDAMTGYPENTDDYNEGTVPSIFRGKFTGVPNNGTITLPYTVSNGFNGVGNPYPSPINVAAFFTDNSANLEPGFGIFFWRKKNDSEATSYAILSMDGYVANDGGVESPDEGQYTYGGQQWENYFETTADNEWTISQGQGFFVRAATGATEIEFNNDMRQNPEPGQPFFRNANTEPVEKSKLWFNLSAPGQGFSQTSLVYNPEATMGIDFGRDAKHFTTSGLTAVYTFADADKLVIQSRSAFEDTDVVPLGFRVNNAGEFTITLHRKEGVFEGGQKVYLRDNVLDIIHDIKNGAYTFTTEAGTFDSRFDIIYKNGALAVNDNVIDANSVVVYKQDGTLKINSGTTDMQVITVYDLRGRILYSADNINNTEYNISNLAAQQQVLLVEINTTKGKVTKKVIY